MHTSQWFKRSIICKTTPQLCSHKHSPLCCVEEIEMIGLFYWKLGKVSFPPQNIRQVAITPDTWQIAVFHSNKQWTPRSLLDDWGSLFPSSRGSLVANTSWKLVKPAFIKILSIVEIRLNCFKQWAEVRSWRKYNKSRFSTGTKWNVQGNMTLLWELSTEFFWR